MKSGDRMWKAAAFADQRPGACQLPSMAAIEQSRKRLFYAILEEVQDDATRDAEWRQRVGTRDNSDMSKWSGGM
jgi:hypothetical protein